MKRALTRRSGLLVLALVLLSIPATIPFWHPDFIFTADSPLHLWRVYELDRAIRLGAFYPRWAPDLYFGYGYPVFNFYPPFSYYLVETLYVLGLGLANSFKAVFSFCVLLGAGGAFLLARDIYGDGLREQSPSANRSPESSTSASADTAARKSSRWNLDGPATILDAAALVAAVAFGYAPYLLIDIYIRGAIAETVGLALLPLFIWSLRRVLVTPRGARIALAAVIGAVYLTGHNLTAFFSAPILAVYVLLFVFQQPVWRERWRRVGAAILVALGTLALSAFYWLPSIAELSMVYVGQPSLSREALFQTLVEHIQPVANVVQRSWLYEYPEGSFPLGLTSTLLAVSGALVGIYWMSKRVRIELIFFWVISILAALSLTELARGAWLAVPQLWVIQFTWRLTVFVIPGAALAVGLWVIAADGLSRRWRAASFAPLLVAAVLGAILILTSTVNLKSKPWFTAMPDYNLPQVLARYEVDFRQTGMSSMNEYLPIWTRNVPFPESRRRNNQAVAAPDASVELVSVQPARWELKTDSAEPFTLALRKFYYPDWYAWLDGQSLTAQPSTNVGLLSVEVPAGAHQIVFERRSLTVRDIAWLLTGAGILGLIGWWIYAIRRGESGWGWSALAFGLAALVFLIPHTRALAPSYPEMTPAQVEVDPSLRLVGLATDSSVPQLLQVRLYWHVKQRPPLDQLTTLQLVDADGKAWTTRRQLSRYGTAGTQYWMPNQLVEDWYELFIPEDMPAGTYTLKIARGDGALQDAGTVQLTAPSSRPAPPQVAYPLDASFGANIRLVGVDAAPPAFARPGDRLPVTLYWQATGDVLEDFSVFVHLLDRDTRLGAQEDSLPNNGFTPSMLWAPGQIILDPHTLTLPANIRPGEYQLVTGLYRFSDVSRLPVFMNGARYEDDFVPLGTVKVSADRPFQPQHQTSLQLGPDIQLEGFSWETTDGSNSVVSTPGGGATPILRTPADTLLNLTLAWRANAKPSRDATVFVHVLDSAGGVVAQKDNPPVDSYYPTRIWDAGERVIDSYALPLPALPPGDYQVLVGMYDSATLERLAITDAQGNPAPNNAVLLGQLRVE